MQNHIEIEAQEPDQPVLGWIT